MAVSRINEAGLNVNQYGNRNLIINGAMQVAQRGTSSTGLGASSGYYTCDRWRMNFNTSGRLTMTQEAITDLPGFANCIKLACTTADTSIASGENVFLQHRFEGQNLQQLQKGTSTAKEVTLSFYVKGNASATYTAEIRDQDNTRFNGQEFSVTTSWTRVSLTYAGDTTGTFDDDNANSLTLGFFLHAGSSYTGGTFSSNTWHNTTNQRAGDNQTSFFDSTSRTFFITGVQLEVGDTATDFEHRTFDDERERCERYFQKWDVEAAVGAGLWYTVSVVLANLNFRKIMRTSPTMSVSSVDFVKAYRPSASIDSASGTNFDVININSARFNLTMASNGTAGEGAVIQVRPSEYIYADAEL
jgi:hypothetical protein